MLFFVSLQRSRMWDEKTFIRYRWQEMVEKASHADTKDYI